MTSIIRSSFLQYILKSSSISLPPPPPTQSSSSSSSSLRLISSSQRWRRSSSSSSSSTSSSPPPSSILPSVLGILFVFICLTSTNRNVILAKNIDLHENNNNNNNQYENGNQCESIEQLFDVISISKHMKSLEKNINGDGGGDGATPTTTTDDDTKKNEFNAGKICTGNCCDEYIEKELINKSTHNFDRLLRDHTRSLRYDLESTAKIYKDHILELSYQSENKTLNLFSQVYRRMAPLSKHSILELYDVIRSYITAKEIIDFDIVVKNFFIKLFPVAYHHAVHSSNDNLNPGDFHTDYKTCLMHIFEDLQPFGNIPKTLTNSLKQSLGTATVFITSLEKAAKILASTEELYTDYLTSPCKEQLVKIHYCSSCKGIHRNNNNKNNNNNNNNNHNSNQNNNYFNNNSAKPCHSYCLNVMRGCLMFYIRELDKPWTQTVQSLETFWHQSINTNIGIEDTIKHLDAKLSEAIMQAMENGPDLEKKVQKACGTPTLLPSDVFLSEEPKILTSAVHKWATPPSTEMLQLLVTMDKSKDFYSNIVDSICQDDEYKQTDDNCWTGERIANYSFPVQHSSVDKQQYNPEVPLVKPTFTDRNNIQLSELSDELLKVRHQVVTAMMTYTPQPYSDVQSDMARHDEEGSGGGGGIDGIGGPGDSGYRDDLDDEEDSSFMASGDGSGDGDISTSILTRIPNTNSEITNNNNNNNGNGNGNETVARSNPNGSVCRTQINILLIYINLTFIILYLNVK